MNYRPVDFMREPCPVCAEACFVMVAGKPQACATCAGRGYVITEPEVSK